MTHARFLNDWSEIDHGVQLVSEMLQKLSDNRSGKFRSLLRKAKLEWDEDWRTSKTNAFIASFCEAGDALEQWRGYTPTGGCAIGFSGQGLRSDAASRSYWLMPCIYSSAAKDRELTRLVQQNEELFVKSDRGPKSADAINDNIFSDALMQVPRFKSLTFQSEREWRLFMFDSALGPEDAVDFVAKPTGIVPFLFFPIPKANLSTIVLSPFATDESAFGIRWFLDEHECQHVNILRSKVSLRR